MYLRALIVLGAAVMVVGMLRGESSLRTFLELQRSRGVLRDAVHGLARENAGIADEIARLKQSPSYARKVLRDKYHVTDEGEDIIFFAE